MTEFGVGLNRITGWKFADGTLESNYRIASVEDGILTVYQAATPSIPKTGDDTQSPLPLALAGAAMAGLGAALLVLRRREDEELSMR